MVNKRMFFRALPLAALCFILCGIAQCPPPPPPTPPTQEGAGPGDNKYLCDPESGVFFNSNEAWSHDDYVGGYPLGGYIYSPSCAERPEEAPVVFFFHMGAGDTPVVYEAFHRHLAAKGYIVIAPSYHRPPTGGNLLGIFDEAVTDWVEAGIKGAKVGYEYYKNELPYLIDPGEYPYGIPTPDDERGLVYGAVGHSVGTAIAAALANPTKRQEVLDVESVDFPWNPKAVVMMSGGQVGDLSPRCPGWYEIVNCLGRSPKANDPRFCPNGPYTGGQHCLATDGSLLSGDLSAIDYNPLWIVMVGEKDWEGGETPELQAYCKATSITDKHYLRVLSDEYGYPPLQAKHTSPAGASLFPPIWTDQVDALDYYAYWKVVTAAMNCVTKNEYCEYVGEGTPDETYMVDMGKWSDDKDVKKMQHNPGVWDNANNCHQLVDACDMVNTDTWNWRGATPKSDPCPN